MPSINRTCRPTAISSPTAANTERPAEATLGALFTCPAPHGRRTLRSLWIVCLLLLWLATGCTARVQANHLLAYAVTPFTNVRPVVHVGVLAPFEGLYRRSGYSALDAVRAAEAAAPPARTGVIPLALDTSLDPARAAAKIVASTNVRAVVGPLTPQEGMAAAPALDALAWFAPWAVAEEGFVSPQGPHWREALAAAMGEAARTQGAQRLLVGGLPTAWEPLLRAGFGPIPTIHYVGPDAPAAKPQPGDALLWLGAATDGAAAAHAVRTVFPSAPIWLAPWAVDLVFFEHLRAAEAMQAPTPQGIFTILWIGPHYAAWATDHPHMMPSAYLMYEAALEATAIATASPLPAQSPWQWRAVAVGPQGVTTVPDGVNAASLP